MNSVTDQMAHTTLQGDDSSTETATSSTSPRDVNGDQTRDAVNSTTTTRTATTSADGVDGSTTSALAEQSASLATSSATFDGAGSASQASPSRPSLPLSLPTAPAGTAATISSPTGSSASSSLSPLSPPTSAGGTASAAPPPLYPRASAPPAAVRRVPGAAGAGNAGPALKAGVRGAPLGGGGGMKIPPSLAAKMAAMTSGSRAATPNPAAASSSTSSSPSPSPAPSGSTSASASGSATPSLKFRPPPAVPAGAAVRTPPPPPVGATPTPAAGGMMARRRGMAGAGLTLSGMGVSTADTTSPSSASPAPAAAPAGRRRPEGMKLSNMAQNREAAATNGAGAGADGANGNSARSPGARETGGTPFSNFRKIVDPSGRLNFASKAVVHADGVDFSSGASFKIKMDDLELFEELGKGNYGTVQKVWHKPTKVTMALKEIRLELDDSKLKTIITELDILHRAVSPHIIDFYGAFFVESCVYYCMEYMDAGSLEKFSGCAVPEDVLARVTSGMVEGLRFLKDELKIMHRDVKPTNVLMNKSGMVKLCDFGVSGQLDRSLAKTNIGCQSYMAPERIKGESQGQSSSYTASSDVWSLGLSIIEFAIGHYPYPPETYQNVFAQLTAIVHGDPPALPDEYSDLARDFVASCLEKVASRRPTYGQLLEHPFLKQDRTRDVDMVGWIQSALDYRELHPKDSKPALA